ncbi:hypothetical protein [Kutzneria sp. 744]|uniref:hypothetical protein n=1 Tax=Kutzneria sp. (strain 744) TaxID=345341 RepID=UPI0003EEDA2B|nr:hypothetical protein [Kutzneria sp. 744]EWM11618.1 hypothetical protein KUTG_01922 [Kutzneria sp. 744]
MYPKGFADDPIASHSAQFGLGRAAGLPVARHAPSAIGVRPWNLRAATAGSPGVRVGVWRYDHRLQVAVLGDGRRLTDVLAADPSAESVSDLDGDEGKSEDWRYDFCPDEPGTAA